MGWELQGTPKTHRVTLKLANEYANMEAVHTDRPLSERRLGVYRALHKKGGMRPVTWACAYCKETEQMIRVNGKHTSTLYAGMTAQELGEQYVIVEEYICDTLEDVASLYATFDSKVQSRSSADINRSFAAVVPELDTISAHIINVSVAGLAWAATPTQATQGTAAERAERLLDNVDIVQWLNGLLTGGTRGGLSRTGQPLCRAPVVGVMVQTYRKAKNLATEFWTMVRDETGTKPTTPDRKLAKYLSTMSVAIGSGQGKAARFKATSREFYVKAIHAWNAWRKNENTNLAYVADAKLPTVV